MQSVDQQRIWLEEDRGLLISELSDGSFLAFIIVGSESCWTADDDSYHSFDDKQQVGEFLLALLDAS